MLRRRVTARLLAVLVGLVGCAHVDVVVVNEHPRWRVRDLGLRGCDWPEVLEPGETTPVGTCLVGEGPLTFLKQDLDPPEDALFDWFPYRTEASLRLTRGAGPMEVLLTPDGLIQDFDRDGPRGH